MKRFLAVVMFLVVSISVVYGGWFPITAWGIRRDTCWVDSVKIWNGNSEAIGWYGENYIEDLLNKGEQCGIDFIMHALRTNSIPISLSFMARGQFSTYESEEHNSASITEWPPAAGYFDADSCIGDTITDSLASNNKAWKVLVNVHQSGYIQRGLVQHLGHRQRYLYRPYPGDSLRYEARFYLRIPNTDGQPDYPVCRLEVFRDSVYGSLPDTVLDSLTLYRHSFTDTTSYEPFSLWFTKDTSMATHGDMDLNYMDYRIWWYDNYDLYADKVEVRDTIYYNLEEGNYNQAIDDIVFKWDDYPALAYYYLWDEPELNLFDAFYLVKHKMGQSKPPITCVSKKYHNHNHYIKFIKDCYGNDNETPLLVDRYSLDPDANNADTIQNRFNDLCAWMDTVREIADTTNNAHRPVWYFCQAHSWIKENGDTALRDPTPEEMWAIVGLGLAHGAKGIWYFRYMSRYYDDNPDSVMFHALEDWDGSNWEHNSKWEATQRVNTVIQKVDTFLLDFDFKLAFYGGNLSQDYYNFIKSTSFDTTEFGLFEDSDNLKYFLIVSRRDTFSSVPDTLSDSTLITLGLDGSLYSGWYYIRDCYSGEPLKYDSTSGGEAPTTVYFDFYLKDCHFKLFQIVPFSADGKINSDSTYTDYPFVKVKFGTATSLSIGLMDMTVWDNEELGS